MNVAGWILAFTLNGTSYLEGPLTLSECLEKARAEPTSAQATCVSLDNPTQKIKPDANQHDRKERSVPVR